MTENTTRNINDLDGTELRFNKCIYCNNPTLHNVCYDCEQYLWAIDQISQLGTKSIVLYGFKEK